MPDKIMEILMRRDGLDKEEARDTLYEAMDGVNWYVERGCYEEAEQCWEETTGLEVDYLMEMLLL